MAKGYKGKIYPVNPNRQELMDLPCYPNISSIQEPVDLAIIIVKAEFVIDVAKECACNHVGSLLVISAGFSELDKECGTENERELRNICREANMRMAGPNCLGIANIPMDLWACSLSNLPTSPVNSGNSVLISQSGATGFGPLLNITLDRNVGLKYIITTGNETDLTVCDFMEYLLEDNDIHSIGILMEGLKETKRFCKLARKAKEKAKPIAVLKVGESEVGARAAASHTASMTGDMAVFNALCNQMGIMKAGDYDELIELMQLSQMKKKLKGRRLCSLSHSGGIAGFTGDLLAKYGFYVPVFGEETQKEIDVFLKGFGSPKNPLDLSIHLRAPYIADIIQSVEAHEEIDGYVFASHGSVDGVQNMIKSCEDIDKPQFFIWSGRLADNEGLDVLRNRGLPISFSIDKFAHTLSKLMKAQETVYGNIEPESEVLLEAGKSGALNEKEGKSLVKNLGISIPKSVIVLDWEAFIHHSPDFFDGTKYVMKVLSKHILHKSDIGGVLLGIQDRDNAQRGFEQMMALGNVTGHTPEGVLLEEMVDDGLDLVVGIRHDEIYGPVLVMGLGGIYTELFKLVNISILPISKTQILSSLYEIGGVEKLMSGYRGQPAYDVNALVDAIKKLCDFVICNENRIKLFEINPIRVMPGNGGVYALDCVVQLSD